MSFRIAIILLLGLGSATSYCQNFTVAGKLIDKESKKPLEAATVFVETVKDSSLVTYTITDKNGDFELEGKSKQKALHLYVSFVGYPSYDKILELKEERNIDINTIALSPQAENLADVLVMAKRAPLTFKKDTVEFNTASFKTKKGANVEDLLKKLPGFEVDSDGTITINGKPVNKVLVNGKPFFGNDPTIATRNLTKAMVSKIQVSDSRSKTEAFTGEKGDGENKTINIRIDKDKNKGAFGRAALGGGTDQRFQYAGLANYFDNDLHLSVLGGGNNINVSGFDFGEIEKMFGRGSYYSSGIGGRNINYGQGITNSRIGGANYADDWGKNTEASTNYFYTAADSYQNRKSNAQNILPDRTFFSNSVNNNVNNSDNHNIKAEFETTIDSTLFIEIHPEFGYSEGSNRNTSMQQTLNENRQLTNESKGTSNSHYVNKDFSNKLSMTQRYGTEGGFFQLNVNANVSDNNSASTYNSETLIYNEDSLDNGMPVLKNEILRDQLNDGKERNSGYNARLNWNLPIIAQKAFITLGYDYNANRREDAQYVYDRGDGANPTLNQLQSTDYTNKNKASRPKVGFRYRGEDLNVRTNFSYVMRTLASKETFNAIDFENKFDAIEVNTNVRYKFDRTTNISLRYDLNNNAPNVTQLSPFINVRNPLFISQGNPDLKPSNNHGINLNFSKYNVQKEANIYLYSGLNISTDDVIQKSTIDEDLVRNTTYTNINGNYNVNIGSGYGKKIKLDSLSSLRYNLGMSLYLRRQVNFNNGVQYNSRTSSYSPRVGLNLDLRDYLDLAINYSPSFSTSIYKDEIFENTDFTRHMLSLLPKLTFGDLEFANDITYTYNSNIAPGFQKSSVFWNSVVNYSVINDNGLISLKAYDVLNQSTDTRRYASFNNILWREFI